MNSYSWNDLTIGLAASFDVQVRTADLDRFHEMSGDSNRLHLDEIYAQENGFKARVVYGLLVAAYYSKLVGVYLPGRYCLLHGLDVDFIAPVYPEEKLKVTGAITHLNQAYRQATLSAMIFNEGGTKVSRAKIRVGLHGT
jgi:3-hydroxybutyryl-CoA dehydratase